MLFLEELASIVLTPFVLYWSLPACVPSILSFVRDFTTHVDGVGDICSLAAFDFARHGNTKYGSPAHAPKVGRLNATLRNIRGLNHSECLKAHSLPAWRALAMGGLAPETCCA